MVLAVTWYLNVGNVAIHYRISLAVLREPRVGKSPLDRKIHFEIHACLGDRWTIRSSSKYRDRSIEQANVLLSTRQFDAVKVTREGGKDDSEEIIFQEECHRVEKKITIIPVETAPACKKLNDFYLFPARLTIGRLLRKYLDENAIMAVELLHNYGHLKWLERNDVLLNQAVQCIARIQSRESGEKHHLRVDKLYDVIGRAIRRSSRLGNAEEHYEVLKKDGLDAMINGVNESVQSKDRDYLIRAALASYVSDARDWERKLKYIVDLAEAEPEETSFSYLDEIIAEIFDGAAAIKEVLGYQKNLGSSLQTLVRLSSGSYEPMKRAGACLEMLNRIGTKYDMPCTREVLLSRVEREVGSINRLAREGQESEASAFSSLMAVMVENDVLSKGSGGMGEAVTMRAKVAFAKPGKDQSSERAIDDTLGMLPTKAAKFGYLVSLTGSDFGAKNQGLVISRLTAIVDSMTSAADLARQGADNVEIITAAAGVRDRLLSTNLPDEWRLRFARRIYTLLIGFADEGEAMDAANQAKKKPNGKPAAKGETRLKAGEYIFHEGEAGSEAYLIKSGQVEISRKSGDRDIVIARAGPGSIIGEMALIDSKPRMASVKTLKKTVLAVIPKKDLKDRLDRLEEFDPVLRFLMDMFVKRMRDHPIIEQ